MSGVTEAVAEAPAAKAPKGPPKSFTTILHDDKKNEMLFQAYLKPSTGKVSAYVVHRIVKHGEGEKAGKLVTDKTTRGASQEYDSLEDAKVALQKGIDAATKAGWKRSTGGGGGGGFKPRADAFDLANLPAPIVSAKAKK